jgi:hypothetical protein
MISVGVELDGMRYYFQFMKECKFLGLIASNKYYEMIINIIINIFSALSVLVVQ